MVVERKSVLTRVALTSLIGLASCVAEPKKVYFERGGLKYYQEGDKTYLLQKNLGEEEWILVEQGRKDYYGEQGRKIWLKN